jgi:hypothetical protein
MTDSHAKSQPNMIFTFVSQEVYQKDDKRKCKWWDSRRKFRAFEPIIGCKHPIIASGATPIESTDRAPDRKLVKRKIFLHRVKIIDTHVETLRLYSNQNNSTIASGANPIGSADRAPDDWQILGYSKGVKNRLHYWWQTPDNKLDISLPLGGILHESNKVNPIILGIITAKQGSR